MAMTIFDEVRSSRYEARIARDEGTKIDAYGLRYDSYLWYGHIPENSKRLFSDPFDDLVNATTIVVYKDRLPVGSVRTCLLRRGGDTTSPGRQAFPHEVERLLVQSGPERQGHDGLEMNRLVRSPVAADDQALVFMLLRLAGWIAITSDSRVAVMCARPNHVPFYRRMRFREEGGLRLYPGLTCAMQLLACTRADYDDMRRNLTLLDPEAGVPGGLDGLLDGQTVRLSLPRRA